MNKLKVISIALIFCCIFLGRLSWAETQPSPIGRWQTISDITQRPRAIMSLSVKKGVLNGRIVKVFKEPGDTGFCRKCSGKFKDKNR